MDRLSQFADVRMVTGPPWPGVSYFCSTRQGGISQGPWSSLNVGLHTGDHPAHVIENRQRLIPSGRSVVWLRQVHGTDVHDVDVVTDHPDASRGGVDGTDVSPVHEVCADAVVTSAPGHALAIMTADCLPVVLGSTDGRVIGVAHAGWRGLAAGVLENTLTALQKKYSGPGKPSWRAWVGPGISQPSFEVGDEVRHAFMGTDLLLAGFFVPSEQQGKWLADLAGIARYRLQKWGVGQVDVSEFCTYRRSDLFYSYRRDGVTGRLVTLAWQETAP